jgi:hypothetical protein
VDPRPGIRLTDAEREHAVGRLFTAHRDGRISLEELDRRLARVYGATVAGELEPVLADVPTAAERRALGGEVVELDAGVSGLTRTGRWSVPRRLRVQQHVGAGGLVLLDFTAAAIAHPQIDVELRLGAYGSARLAVPRGASADLSRLRGGGRLGRTDVPTEQGTSGVHLVVTGLVARRRFVQVCHPGTRRRWWAI